MESHARKIEQVLKDEHESQRNKIWNKKNHQYSYLPKSGLRSSEIVLEIL